MFNKILSLMSPSAWTTASRADHVRELQQMSEAGQKPDQPAPSIAAPPLEEPKHAFLDKRRSASYFFAAARRIWRGQTRNTAGNANFRQVHDEEKFGGAFGGRQDLHAPKVVEAIHADLSTSRGIYIDKLRQRRLSEHDDTRPAKRSPDQLDRPVVKEKTSAATQRAINQGRLFHLILKRTLLRR